MSTNGIVLGDTFRLLPRGFEEDGTEFVQVSSTDCILLTHSKGVSLGSTDGIWLVDNSERANIS